MSECPWSPVLLLITAATGTTNCCMVGYCYLVSGWALPTGNGEARSGWVIPLTRFGLVDSGTIGVTTLTKGVLSW